jgi:hypothetical protein
MILQLTALKTLLGGYFTESGLLVVFFVGAFSFVYAGLGGFDAISKGVRPQIIVIFLSTAVITVSIFLENGLAATYSRLVTTSHPDFTIPKALFLALTGIIIMTTQYLLDHSLWHTALRLKPQSRSSILFLTVFNCNKYYKPLIFFISDVLSGDFFGYRSELFNINTIWDYMNTINCNKFFHLPGFHNCLSPFVPDKNPDKRSQKS